MLLLVEAELARLQRKHLKAARLYERCFERCKKDGFPHNEVNSRENDALTQLLLLLLSGHRERTSRQTMATSEAA